MERRQLEVDEHRPAIGPHHDVLLLVKVVVANTHRMELSRGFLEEVKEILGQVRREVQRQPLREWTQENVAGPGPKAALGRHRAQCGEGVWRDRRGRRDGRGPRLAQEDQRPFLPPSEQPGHEASPETAADHPSDHFHGRPGRRLWILPGDQFDAAKHIVFELVLDTNACHGRYVTPDRFVPSPLTPPSLTTSSPPSPTPSPAPPSHRGPLASPGSISVRGLTHRFGEKVALHPLDLDIPAGGVVGLLGPNGSGKSTFMRLLVGLVPCRTGKVWVDGLELRSGGTQIRHRTTYAPGEMHLYREMKGKDHLAFLLRGRGREAIQRAEAAAREFGLPLEQRVRGYSHGMKRQLVFAAVMAPDVPIRILDEISEGLDPAKRSQVLDLIEADARRGTTILLSSHHPGEVDRSCERLIFLNDGRLIADETASSVSVRAARTVQVTYPEGAALEQAPELLRGAGVESVRVDHHSLHIQLDSDDPRAFFTALGTDTRLPAPVAIEHGKLSLRELYRSLYGVEGT